MPRPDDPQLGLGFDVERVTVAPARNRRGSSPSDGRVVRVRPDVVGIDGLFDYVVPSGTHVEVGDVVRVQLGPRRVRGWVVAVDVETEHEDRLLAVRRVSGRGPTPELIELADWAAWRWAGRPVHLLRVATPEANVDRLPARTPVRRGSAVEPAGAGEAGTGRTGVVVDEAVTRALDQPRAVLRWPPGGDRYGIVRAAIDATPDGHPLVLVPSAVDAVGLANRLRGDGLGVALFAGTTGAAAAGEWARARAGAVVVGTRTAAWAPLPTIGRVVVLDEHDESYQGDRTPTWNARDVAIERAARAAVPCLLVSPTPSLEALAWGEVVDPGPGARRDGWPRLEVVDQRELDPALGPLFSPALVQLVRSPGRVLCVLNRTGRVRLLACGSCRTIARCASCDAAVSSEIVDDVPTFVCGRDPQHRRPTVCLECGATRFRNLRLGVSKAREELEALVGEPVGEVTASSTDPLPDARVVIGTEAVLHRFERADAIAFLDLDQHVLAPRFRAAEQALALLARAARLVCRGAGAGGRGRAARVQGRLLVQTADPDHPVIAAVRHRDPARFTDVEGPLRSALGLPPHQALAVVSGAGAEDFVGALPAGGVSVQGPREGAWRLRALDHDVLCDALAVTPRPHDRLRVEVDPLGV